MSTRAHVIVTGDRNHYLYQHCDGYPEYLGNVLKNELSPDLDSQDKIVAKLSKILENENYGLHGDEEYVYVVHPETQSVIGYEVPFGVKELDLINCKQVFWHKFNNYETIK